MTELLLRLFVKDRDDIRSPRVRQSYGMLSSIVGIILNLIIAVGKVAVGILFGSIAIQADGINNFSDAGSQIISLISFKMASKPADKEHPFGHARIEYVASMIVSFLILIIGYDLFTESVRGLFSGESDTEFSYISIVVLSVSIVIKLWLCLFNRKLGRKINSEVMMATSADSFSDAIATFAVLISMIVLKITGFGRMDAIMGVIVAVIIFIAGIKILNETKNSILGHAADPQTVADISEIVSRYPDALGIHDMVVHNYGPGIVIASLHIEVDGSKNIFDTHDMIDLIEKQLEEELHIRATIHMDPIVTDDEQVTELKQLVRNVVKEIDERFDIHDLRFVRGNTHSNLIFDVCVPFDVKYTDAQLREMISFKIREKDESLVCVITVDKGEIANI